MVVINRSDFSAYLADAFVSIFDGVDQTVKNLLKEYADLSAADKKVNLNYFSTKHMTTINLCTLVG